MGKEGVFCAQYIHRLTTAAHGYTHVQPPSALLYGDEKPAVNNICSAVLFNVDSMHAVTRWHTGSWRPCDLWSEHFELVKIIMIKRQFIRRS